MEREHKEFGVVERGTHTVLDALRGMCDRHAIGGPRELVVYSHSRVIEPIVDQRFVTDDFVLDVPGNADTDAMMVSSPPANTCSIGQMRAS